MNSPHELGLLNYTLGAENNPNIKLIEPVLTNKKPTQFTLVKLATIIESQGS